MDDQTAGGAGGPEPPPKPPLADPIAGELVTETLDYDGGRQVTVYVPPDPPQAVVFAGDGQGISQWGGFLEAADVPSTMIVGVYGLADEMPRLREYSPVFDPERFAAHERFFVEEVRRWARSRFGVALPAERSAVFGVSAGGELALALGLRHPDVYGAVFSGSPGGGYKPSGVMPSSIPRTYLVAGTLETVLPQQRDPVGGRAARCRCGRRDERTGRVARRRAVAGRVPTDGGVGVWTMKHRRCGVTVPEQFASGSSRLR
jgi:pimeloyl-ACP methyl ester carboxylesterase